MPSVGIHLIAADIAFAKLPSSPDQDVRNLSAVVRRYPEMSALGAVGPDLLYYLGIGPKISSAVANVFHYLGRISSIIGEVGNLAQQAGLPNVGDRIRQLGDIVMLAVGTGQTGLLAAVVELNDIITGSPLFKPSPQQEGKSEDNWNWGDILHDRISGSFANRLIADARASQNYSLLAYSTGYMTHIATDCVGHAYVNSVVGGPARGWNMRHTLAEKFMDAAVYARRSNDINTSRLHERFSSLADSLSLHSLCDRLAASIQGLPQTPSLGYPLPAPCSSEDIKEAFDSMCTLFRLVTEDSYVSPPKAPSITIPPLPGQYGSLTNLVTNLPGPGRPRTITDWLKFLLAILLAVPAVVADMVRFLVDLASGVVTYPFAAAVYLFESYLYTLYRQVRWFLVVSGICFPCVDELSSPLALQFASCRGAGDDNYPHVPPKISSWKESLNAITFSANNFDYLNYPTTIGEKPHVTAAPYPANSLPELFIQGLARDQQYVADWLGAATPAHVRALSAYKGGFGNAADFSVLLLGRPDVAEKINLDSDRGYGYKQWRCDGGLDTGLLTNERFI